MRSKAILEELKSKAYTGEAAALGDALGDMVHWLAAHREDLRERDVDTLMSVCLALYKNELEKSWDVSIYDTPGASASASLLPTTNSALSANTNAADSARDAHIHHATSQFGVETAIEAMVALRRPAPSMVAVNAVPSAVPSVGTASRRRWTDSECWSLTLRTA